MSTRPPTVCIFGHGEKEEGGRAWAIQTGLTENGIKIKFCRTSLNGFFAKGHDLYRTWQGISDDIDAMYVLFMGYYLMPLAWYLARRRKIPIILDALVSQYDTEVTDRKRVSHFHPRAWFLWGVDYFSCLIADAVVVDTREHKKFFIKRFYVDTRKIIVMSVGCRSDLFKPLPQSEKSDDEFVITFHGSFIPLQGIEHIMEAAKILQDKRERVHFSIIGTGQLFVKITRLAEQLRLTNVEFLGRKPLRELPYFIARGDVCLGIFGTSDKAMRVIPNKVYECLSCGKPVITERSPAALEELHDNEDVLMVEPGSGAGIAEKILELKRDATLRIRLSARARAISLEKFSARTVVKPLVNWIESRP